MQVVFAHCDVPCGIYETAPAQIAADTVKKMVDKILALPTENPSVEDRNNFVRMVWTKEEHARKCKEELYMLWSDFFKPEHLEKFPNLHDIFWKAVKLCSQNKQHVDKELAQQLVDTVHEISHMVEEVKATAK
jgi:nickel superoxide dismutase